MHKAPLLPGVTTDCCPPAIVCDAHQEIRRARRRAFARDALQLLLLVAVDYLFLRWPESRMPMMTRTMSLAFLQATNGAILVHIWISRQMPRWSARRIAATWCRSEQERFDRRLS